MGWSETSDNFINCFRKTGALPQDQECEKYPFAGLEEDDACLEKLVHQFDPDMTADEYMIMVSSCLTFEEAQLEATVTFYGETPLLSKQIQLDKESEDEDEIEPKGSSITSYDVQ